MIFLFLILILIIIIFFLLVTTIGEADLTLLFYECFGKSLDAFEGQVIWITGASSGIGEALSYKVAEHKAKLVLSGRNRETLENVKRNCLELSKSLKQDDILVVPFDIGDYSAHKGCFKQVLDHFGQLDILVNNAGRSQRASFQDIDIAVHEEIFRTNTFGPVMLTQTVAPYFMKRKSGHVVVTSSTAGIMGAPFSASYTGSKHAIQGFFETMRIELGFENVDVTIICPGPVESNIVENASTGKPGEVFKNNPGAVRKCVSSSRCAKLISCAIVNKIDQAWISNQPVLLCHYFVQYTPSFFRNFLRKKLITKKLLKELRDGK